MAEQAGRELSSFAQAVRNHPRFDGHMETLSVDGMEEILKGTFRILQLTDEVRQAQLAQVMLNHNVLQSWAAYCRSEGIEDTATLSRMISFLKATYDTVSTTYQALDELVALKFKIDEDLPMFNQKFDYLVTRADFPVGQPSITLNHYRRTMPVDIKKELFATDITTVWQAKNRALVLWRTWRALKSEKESKVKDDGPAPMEIDRVEVREAQPKKQNFQYFHAQRLNSINELMLDCASIAGEAATDIGTVRIIETNKTYEFGRLIARKFLLVMEKNRETPSEPSYSQGFELT
ncbi:hypothetical protein IWW36_005505, partial [Coemansia brasiliensis]